MHETAADLASLQALLDASYRRSGAHLRSIFTEELRIAAVELPEILSGVRLLTLATVTATGQPRAAPVDGLFYRGHFWFGTSFTSVRYRHVEKRPSVSATHIHGESLAVIVHGVAVPLDLELPEQHGFRDYLHEVYPTWQDWGEGAAYARIDARTMFASRLPIPGGAAGEPDGTDANKEGRAEAEA